MAILAHVPCSPADLLAEAVDLARAAEQMTRGGTDPGTAARLRVLADDLRTVTRAVEEQLPAPPAPCGRGHLHVDRTTSGTVRVQGGGPAAEGELVRAALVGLAARGPRACSPIGARLWDALVALARDGLDRPSTLPTPLGLVGRTGA